MEIFSVNSACPCAVASCTTFAQEKVKTGITIKVENPSKRRGKDS